MNLRVVGSAFFIRWGVSVIPSGKKILSLVENTPSNVTVMIVKVIKICHLKILQALNQNLHPFAVKILGIRNKISQ